VGLRSKIGRQAIAGLGRKAAVAGLGLMATVVAGGQAQAGSMCPGQYQVSQLYPWPAYTSFRVEMLAGDDNSRQRLTAFDQGMQSGGITVTPDGTMSIQVVFSILAPRSSSGGGVYNDLNWRPPSAGGGSLNNPKLLGSTLNLTVIITDRTQSRQMWIGTMQCPLKSSDTLAVANDIGLGLGQILAKSMTSNASFTPHDRQR